MTLHSTFSLCFDHFVSFSWNLFVAANLTHVQDVLIIVFIILSTQYTMDLSKWIDLTDIHKVLLRTFLARNSFTVSQWILDTLQNTLYYHSKSHSFCCMKRVFVTMICRTLANLELSLGITLGSMKVVVGEEKTLVWFFLYQNFYKNCWFLRI